MEDCTSFYWNFILQMFKLSLISIMSNKRYLEFFILGGAVNLYIISTQNWIFDVKEKCLKKNHYNAKIYTA